MKKMLMLFAVAALALLAFPQSATRAAEKSMTVTIMAQNGSGQDGTATITDMGNGKTQVMIDIKSTSSTPQPAHIHMGTCANLDPKPRYPLTSVVNGKSETTLDVAMSDLQPGAMAINVHKSAAEASVYVACGNIEAMSTGGTGGGTSPAADMNTTTVQMHAQNGSGEDGTATITTNGNGVMVTLKLANGPTVAQPAHIHPGTCANLDPTPRYPLTSAMNGMSETSLNVSMNDLLTGSYAINVHKSAAEASVYVSCGDIVTMSMGGGSTGGSTGGTTGGETGGTTGGTGMPATGTGQEIYLLAGLALLGLTLAGAGLRLARTRA
ncbi:MAG TPA: hypothetical protein VM536_15115 [Chloroflexia bacterium]|nr:hypothetical protein [Chloroflexia bacterium]